MKEQEQKNIEFGKFIARKRLLKRRVMLFNMYYKGATFDIRRQREIMHALVSVCGSVYSPLIEERAKNKLRDFLEALQLKNDIVNIFRKKRQEDVCEDQKIQTIE